MFIINNKDTKMLIGTYFTPFSTVLITDFERKFVCWDRINSSKKIWYKFFQVQKCAEQVVRNICFSVHFAFSVDDLQ